MIDYYAKILWEYHHFKQDIVPSDCIIGFGSHDTNVAERAAELYLNGYGKFIIFTGGLGRVTEKIWKMPEADMFAQIAIKMGVPKDDILIENKSTNTGENISFTKIMLKKYGIDIRSCIVVDKPFKERRTYATLKKQWQELNFTITSPQKSYEEYCEYYRTSSVSKDEFISIMVGDIQRIDLYGKNGFQIHQEIPDYVRQACEMLIKAGYTLHALK
jgi:uncharacterized SAM-binding protein YcdF (DUF218 family)